MKILSKSGLVVACASLLLASQVPAQEVESAAELVTESVSATEVKKAKPAKASSKAKKGTPAPKGKATLQMGEKEKEIPLHLGDYDGGFPGLWVNGFDGKDLKWRSTDHSIVKVDQIGRLFPQGVGTATVFAVAPDGQFATCEVKVSKYGPKPSSGHLDVVHDLTGEATVTFGADLDTGKTGFSTDQNVRFDLRVVNLGEVWADEPDGGLPVWGEIRLYTRGDPFRYYVDSDSGTNMYKNEGDFHIEVDHAKIHMGPAYISLYDKNETSLGFVNYTTAPDVAYGFISANPGHLREAGDRRYGQLTQQTLQGYLNSYKEDTQVWGLSAGYEMDKMFRLQGDIASTSKWSAGNSSPTDDSADPDKKATDYVFKLAGDLTMVPGLKLQAGYSNGILGKDSIYKQDMRFGGQVSYQMDLGNSIYYLKPKAGITMVQLEGRGDLHPLVTGGLLFSWEDKQNAMDYWSSSTRYLEDDYGSYPGIALGVSYTDKTMAENAVNFTHNNNLDTFTDDMLILHASFSTGNGLLVKNFEAAGAVDVVNALSDKMVIGMSGGVKYWMPLSKLCNLETKLFATSFHDTMNDANDYLFLKASLEFHYQRVGLVFDYHTQDLIHGYNDGEQINKLGKLETTFKVWF